MLQMRGMYILHRYRQSLVFLIISKVDPDHHNLEDLKAEYMTIFDFCSGQIPRLLLAINRIDRVSFEYFFSMMDTTIMTNIKLYQTDICYG